MKNIFKYVRKTLKWALAAIGVAYLVYFIQLFCFSSIKISDITADQISLLKEDSEKYDKTIVLETIRVATDGGIGTYSAEIIKSLIDSRPNYRWVIIYRGNFPQKLLKGYTDRKNVKLVDVKNIWAPLFEWLYFIGKSDCFVNLDYKFSKWLSEQSPEFNDRFYRIKQAILYRKIFADRSVDLIFSTCTPSYTFSLGLPQISVNHDVIHLDNPSLVSFGSYLNHTRSFTNNFNSSTKIISISNFTKDCILKYFAGISSDKIDVIRTQMAARFDDISQEKSQEILKKFGIETDKYCVFGSGFWNHKNHPGLIKAFAKMIKEHDIDKDFKLVLMGRCTRRNGGLASVAKKAFDAAKEFNVSDRVVFTDYTTNEEFSTILKNSLFVVNPTFYEGFGMPVAEAMFLKKPVACSHVASLPEVGGDAALYFDPSNVNDIAEKIYQVYSSADLRAQMIEKGERQAANFTNKPKMLGAFVDVIEKALSERNDKNPYKFDWEFCHIK